jgi:hypothetical protein
MRVIGVVRWLGCNAVERAPCGTFWRLTGVRRMPFERWRAHDRSNGGPLRHHFRRRRLHGGGALLPRLANSDCGNAWPAASSCRSLRYSTVQSTGLGRSAWRRASSGTRAASASYVPRRSAGTQVTTWTSCTARRTSGTSRPTAPLELRRDLVVRGWHLLSEEGERSLNVEKASDV